ncbi:nucleotidyltransferase domain-containing protein [Mesorhizobium sp. ASY16-5R]|uniref:nucleotidyltransferase domain-containing protein n=1 Tax=Mesorhizobium sp. ASY16-5R TaxID=3445772 RepID=UPI003F9FBC3B
MAVAAHHTSEVEESLTGILGQRVGNVWVTPDGRIVPPNYGSHDNEADALAELVDRLVAALDPQMIWLFGSRARGDARQDSDFDLLVVAKRHGAFGSDDYEKVYAPVSGSEIGADVVPCGHEDFFEALELRTSFVSRIVAEGRLVYGELKP